ncbi:MAG: hypothetical protein LKG27_07810 [Clostridiaceae bacterium]|jgi:hypothetical protein|nr:hypothetical protein [Clostridiaceae bacterium]
MSTNVITKVICEEVLKNTKPLSGIVKGSTANKQVETVAKEVAERAGAEIEAAYNKVLVKTLDRTTKLKTTTGFNEITNETIKTDEKGIEHVINYNRTSTKGKLEINYDMEGKRKSCTYTSPTGITKNSIYSNGVQVRKFDKALNKEAKWERSKGAPISNTQYGDSIFNSKGESVSGYTICNSYRDKTCESYYFETNKGNPIRKIIDFPEQGKLKDMIDCNLETNVKKYETFNYNNHVMTVHTITHADDAGNLTLAKLNFVTDKFGRDTKQYKFSFPKTSPMKDAEMNYIKINNTSNTLSYMTLSNGSFSSKFGDASYDGAKLKTTMDLSKFDVKNKSDAEIFNMLFNYTLEKSKISKELNPSNYAQLLANV